MTKSSTYCPAPRQVFRQNIDTAAKAMTAKTGDQTRVCGATVVRKREFGEIVRVRYCAAPVTDRCRPGGHQRTASSQFTQRKRCAMSLHDVGIGLGAQNDNRS
jgi:hypothetical protein